MGLPVGQTRTPESPKLGSTPSRPCLARPVSWCSPPWTGTSTARLWTSRVPSTFSTSTRRSRWSCSRSGRRCSWPSRIGSRWASSGPSRTSGTSFSRPKERTTPCSPPWASQATAIAPRSSAQRTTTSTRCWWRCALGTLITTRATRRLSIGASWMRRPSWNAQATRGASASASAT